MLRRKRDSKRTGRTLAVGLAGVLLCLAGFALWGQLTTNAASKRAMQMSALGLAYDDALRSARSERVLELL